MRYVISEYRGDEIRHLEIVEAADSAAASIRLASAISAEQKAWPCRFGRRIGEFDFELFDPADAEHTIVGYRIGEGNPDFDLDAL